MTVDIKQLHEKPPYGMIAILFIGAFTALLNNTLLNVALPSMMEEFIITTAQVQWVTTSYMLVNGILIPCSAFLIQRFPNRNLFLAAMGLFTLGTFVAFISPTFTFLIVGRMLQASGSGLMMPLLMNIILMVFPVEKRGTAMGFFGLVMFVAPAIGPTLSGYIVENYTWRILFAIILPFGIFALIYAFFRLKNITPLRNVLFDVQSVILSSIGFGAILFGFSSVADFGWKTLQTSGLIGIGAISLTIFVLRQLRLDEPMLDFRTYKYPMFTLASIISVTISASMFSGMILTPLYVQTVRDISPFYSGLLMLPGAVIMGIMSPITGRLFDKFGARILALIGLTILTSSTFLLSNLTMTDVLNQLPLRAHPHGTALKNTLQQVSGAIGTAVLLTVMTAKTKNAGIELAQDLATGKLTTSYDIEHLAMLEGINYTFFISTLFALVALILSFFIKKAVPEDEEQLIQATNK